MSSSAESKPVVDHNPSFNDAPILPMNVERYSAHVMPGWTDPSPPSEHVESSVGLVSAERWYWRMLRRNREIMMEDIGDIMTDVTVNVFVTHSTICKTLRTKSSRKCKVPSLQRKFTRDTIRAFASPPALRNLIMLNHVTQITIISDKMRHTCSAITTLFWKAADEVTRILGFPADVAEPFGAELCA